MQDLLLQNGQLEFLVVFYQILLFSDTLVYVGSDDRNMYALSTSSGTIRWKFQSSGAILASPIVANGLVFIGK